jgi:hypothetical protein
VSIVSAKTSRFMTHLASSVALVSC